MIYIIHHYLYIFNSKIDENKGVRNKMIIIGIDPGYAIVGIGVVEYVGNKFRTLEYNAITTPAGMPTVERLKKIYTEMTMYIDKYKPDAVAIEELFFNSNQKTAINVAQARGVLLVAVANKNVPISEYTPLQVKQSVTGYGRADKKQIQSMVKMILGLNVIPKPDDAADALALAICHAHSNKMNNMLGMNGVR